VVGEKGGEILLSRLLEHRQIAAVHHVQAHLTRARYQLAKMRIELRRASCDIQGLNVRIFEKCDDVLYSLALHLFGAGRSCIDVTVHAALIAAIADVDLEHLEPVPLDGRKIGLDDEG
jgi:hypothetical protein